MGCAASCSGSAPRGRDRGQPADDIAALITGAEVEANAAGISHAGYTLRLVEIFAERAGEPEALLAALEEHGATQNLLFPLLGRAAVLRRPGWESTLGRLLTDASASRAATHVVLARPCDDHLKRLAIQGAAEELSLVRGLVVREQVDQATLAFLFDAPDALIRREAAVAVGTLRSGERLNALLASIRRRWRDIVFASPAADGHFSKILEGDPALCADWLRACLGREGERRAGERLRREVRVVVSRLSLGSGPS